MLTTAPPMPLDTHLAKRASGFPHWLRTHRGAVAMAGLLAFAAPLTFFMGALSVMRAPTATVVAGLGLWWTLYGVSLWCLLLVIGYGCERVARPFGQYTRAGMWLLAACSAAALASLLTAGRAAVLIEQGLVHSAQSMQLHGFTVSLIMALLYFAHLRRSREHEQATARLAAAQTTQRRAQRRLVEARLQELQARIDPQLLFEMLDTMRRLYERDAARAERFLDELILFLRASLPRLRAASSSLLREAELARAFVGMHALARATGLDLTVDVAPDAMHARFPPGVLLPLLDAAVCGGTGRFQLTATRSSDGCRVDLTLAAAPSDASITRVRSLLVELYGTSGKLEIESTGSAINVVVKVPYELA